MGRKQRELVAIGDAIERASARSLGRARRQVTLAARTPDAKRDDQGIDQTQTSLPPLRLEPGQRRTLEVGSFVVLGGLGLGFQLGGWPVWSMLAATGVYVGWVVLYAEITVQARRRPAMWQRWRWRRRPRPLGRPTAETVGPVSASAPQPAQE
jgi:hypothetical protein